MARSKAAGSSGKAWLGSSLASTKRGQKLMARVAACVTVLFEMRQSKFVGESGQCIVGSLAFEAERLPGRRRQFEAVISQVSDAMLVNDEHARQRARIAGGRAPEGGECLVKHSRRNVCWLTRTLLLYHPPAHDLLP
jgi:hypothetical protein